jgi:non-specific serine/threonine protein kinase
LGDPQGGRVHAEVSIGLRRKAGNRPGLLRSLLDLGVAEEYSGDEAAASRVYEELETLARAEGDRWFLAMALCNRGSAAIALGNPESARALLREGSSLMERTGDSLMFFLAEANLASAELELGELNSARHGFLEVLTRVRTGDYPELVIYCLEGLAASEVSIGDASRAARLLGASTSLADSLGYGRTAFEQGRHERTEATLCEVLGNEAFAKADAEGQALEVPQAIAYALGESSGRSLTLGA